MHVGRVFRPAAALAQPRDIFPADNADRKGSKCPAACPARAPVVQLANVSSGIISAIHCMHIGKPGLTWVKATNDTVRLRYMMPKRLPPITSQK